jgi:hypothetical protein
MLNVMYIYCSTHNMLPCFQSRSASGGNVSQSALSTNQVSQAANGSQMSTAIYRAKHEITIVVFDQIIHSFYFLYDQLIHSFFYLNVTINHSCFYFSCYLFHFFC